MKGLKIFLRENVPTFVINGQAIVGARSLAEFGAAIEAALSKQQ